MTKEILLEEILTLIPHRYPLLLVDRVIDYTAYKSATGVKNVTFNEPHFNGHFPDKPIMPGVLIVEALAQTSAIMVAKSNGANNNKLVYFMSIDNVKFRIPVVPGDQLILKIETIQNRSQVWKFKGEAFVNDKIVTEATFAAMIVDKKNDK
jgi:3-hydroxyacyl-[acyl-carrier-protein] dehydratase